MKSSTIAVVLALAVWTNAQKPDPSSYNTPIPCCRISPDSVPLESRSAWCTTTINMCNNLCGGSNNIASGGNTCNTVSDAISRKKTTLIHAAEQLLLHLPMFERRLRITRQVRAKHHGPGMPSVVFAMHRGCWFGRVAAVPMQQGAG
jgi:hypothetical protein